MPMDSKSTPHRDRPHLTAREHRYLWLISQGHTPREAFRVMGTGSSPSVATRIKAKLSARTMEHAVFIACGLKLIGEHPNCGTLDGYREHYGRGDAEPCAACRREFTEYAERQKAPVLARVVLTEPELRMLRAFDAGRTFKDVVRNWGRPSRTLDDVRTSLYRKLDVAHLPQQRKLAAALEAGRKLGYLRQVRITSPDPVVPQFPAEPTPLTELEVRTLAVLADGTSLSQAGRVLGGIPGSWVSSRLARIYAKLDVLHAGHGERRDAAVKEARRQGYPV